MKIRLTAVLFLLLCFCAASLLPGTIGAQSGLRIAVLDLQRGEGVEPGEAMLLSEALRVGLVNTGTFNVLERERMEQILAEIGISLSECTDQECALRAGRFLAAEKIVVGTVGRIGETYAISTRLVDVETGRTDMATPVLRADRKEKLLTVCIPKIARCQAFGECDEATEDTGILPGYGDLYIKSDPPGAKVFIDGEEIQGTTPLFVEHLLAGRRRLALEKEAYLWSGLVTVRAGQPQTVEFTLQRGEASLKVISNPMEAEVFLDEEYVGKTPVMVSDFAPGPHLLTLRLNEYKEYNQEVTLESHGITRVEVDLFKPAGLDISSRPVNAEVRLDGKAVGMTPCSLTGLKPGPVTVTLLSPMAHEWTDQVQLKGAETEFVIADLRLKEGTLRLESDPSGAAVYLDGKLIPQMSPAVAENVDYGEHVVRFVLHQYDPSEPTILLDRESRLVSAKLVRQTGSVCFVGTPRGALVTSSVGRLGTLPTESCLLPTGTHSYKVSLAGFAPARGTVTVEDHQETQIPIALREVSLGGALRRSAFVPGLGQVYSDRRRVGTLFLYSQIVTAVAVIRTHRDYSTSKDKHRVAEERFLQAAGSQQDLTSLLNRLSDTQDQLDRSRKWFGVSIGAAIGVYVLNLLDAYIFFPYRGGYESAGSAREPVLKADVEDGRMKVTLSRRF